MMKSAICQLTLVLFCLLVKRSCGSDVCPSNGTYQGNNITKCIFCTWKEKLLNYTNQMNLTENATYNISVCVNVKNSTDSWGSVQFTFTFNSTDISPEHNISRVNGTCETGDNSNTSVSHATVTTPTSNGETTNSESADTRQPGPDSTVSDDTKPTTILASTSKASTETSPPSTGLTTSAQSSTETTTTSEVTDGVTSPKTETITEVAATTTTEAPGNTGGKQAITLQEIARNLTVGYNKPTEEAKVFVATIGEGGLIGSAEEPIFKLEQSKTTVNTIRVEGVDGPVKLVVINSVSNATEIPKLLLNSATEENAPDGTKQIYVTDDNLVAIEAFPENENERNKTAKITGTTFSLEVPTTLNPTLTANAIKQQAGDSAGDDLVITNPVPHCVFFDENQALSDAGCKSTPDMSAGIVECDCNHATVFAVLISVNVVTVPSSVKIVSYVFETLSILFLSVTSFALIKVRNRVRGDRVRVQISLSLSLLALHTVSVLHDAAIHNETVCEMWTVLTQFFLLTSAMWMLMEGLTLLFKTMDSVMRLLSGANARKFSIFRYVISFTIPGLIVVMTAAIGFSTDPQSYMAANPSYSGDGNHTKYQHCWLGEHMLIGGAVVPVAVILLCCTVIAIRMCYVVYRMSAESDNFKPTVQRGSNGDMEIIDMQHIKAALKATLVLLPVLGIPWFLGFFTAVQNGGVQQTFMYLNVIVNGLQGVMLFFVYCVLGKDVRGAILKQLAKKGYRVKRHDHSTSTASSSHRTYSTKLQEGTNGLNGSQSSEDKTPSTASDKL